MNTTPRSLAVLCLLSLVCAPAAFAQAPYIAPMADMFYDDFGSGIVDPAKWYAANKNWGGPDASTGEDYNGGVVPANLRVRDGTLRCTAHGNLYEGDVLGIAKKGKPRANGKRVGACAVTREYFASGSYEIRARVAPVTGVCCAMWTFEYEELYPGDPGFQGNGECYVVNHEIDIEMPGRPGSAHTDIGYDYALCNTWVGENGNEYTSSHMRLPAPQDDGAFHTYRFDWHTGDAAGTIAPRVEFYFDGVPVVTNYTHIPTKAGRFWVGAWFPRGWAGTPDFDTSVFEVDYVKITPFHEENDEPQNETYGSDGLAEPVNPVPPAIGELVTGEEAAAMFPAQLQGMGLHTAKWMQLTNGVEYYYGRFTNLLGTVDGFTGSRNDLHLLRIDYANAPVRMKFVDHTQTSTPRWTTSKTAAQHNALFAINMTMEDANGGPQGYVKVDGEAVPSLQSTAPDGFAFNDDKTYKFDRRWLDTDPESGRPKADAWANVVSHEAYTIHNGVATWGASATFPRANYTFFGTTADGVLWAGTVDGRREGVSDGLGYHEVAALQLALGCVGGVCCDGGGSTTMAIRKDLMTASDICDTQKTSADSSDYYTMNYLSGTQKTIAGFTITIDPVGTERKVINQLLFVPVPKAPKRPRVMFSID